MNPAIKISALAITLNEEGNIDAFIESLWFADEIIVVDSFSTDKTLEIASKHKRVKVIQREFDNFSNQKNFAIAQATNDWIVFFDPDEEISKALANEILEVILKKNAIAYFVKRQFHFMGKALNYSGTQSDWIVRVFHKDFNKYNGNLVHEVIQSKGVTARLKNTIAHYSYTNFDSYTAKLHQYSALQAQMLFEKGTRPNLVHFLFRPWYRFWHQYIIRLGILDGKEGFILTYISAFSVFQRYLNLWLLYRKIK